MRDFDAHVRRHLSRRDVAEDRYDEVVDELASELEARYAALVQRGATDEDAWRDVAGAGSFMAVVRARPRDGDRRSRPPADAPHPGCVLLAARTLAAGSEPWPQGAPEGPRVHRHRHRHARRLPRRARRDRRRRQRACCSTRCRCPKPDRVLLMANQYPLVEQRRGTRSSTPDYDDRLRHVTVFEEQALYNFSGATIESGGVATRMAGMVATPSLFRLLRVVPAHGRIFTETEGDLGNEARVILTDGLWRELFGARSGGSRPHASPHRTGVHDRRGPASAASRSATPTPASGFRSH